MPLVALTSTMPTHIPYLSGSSGATSCKQLARSLQISIGEISGSNCTGGRDGWNLPSHEVMSGMKKPQTAAATLTSASRRLRGRKTERTKGEEQQGVPPFRSLVRPIPYPLESLQGYVARFCTLNGFDHIRWLLPFARSEAGLDASQGRRGAISPEPRGPLCGM